MDKSILVFSNGEKIGDGLIKLPLLHEIRRRLPDYKIIWMTNKMKTVYNNQLKNISNPYGKGHATKRMLKILKNKSLPKNQKKAFYNL